MKKNLLILSVVILFFSFPKLSYAAGEFSASYNVKYDVSEDGVTNVDEKVTLKNNTDKFFPSSFSLIISATHLDDVKANDTDGPLETSVEKLGKKSQVTVKFTKQIGGKDKLYAFDLNFNSKDFVQKNGEVTTISVPKIGSTDGVDAYGLTLSVPVSFADPSFITPEPKNQTENYGKLSYSFSKDQLSQSGVLGIFGTDQTFDFALSYKLENNSILPSVESIGIPSPSSFQQILIKGFEPKPDQVTVDEDGNYRAFFKLNRREKKTVVVNGLAKVNVIPEKKFTPISRSFQTQLTAGRTYWDASNPQIKSKAEGLLSPEDKTNQQKMRKLYTFVVSTLQFDYGRLDRNNFERLGSLTTLVNPDKALTAEYADLLIALARSVGIPTREVVGVAFSNNAELKPLAFSNKNLHAWVEYYDEQGSWKAVDPTWQSTTGGVDYFSQSLINHLAITKRGVSSTEPQTADDAVITFTDQKLSETKDIRVYLEVNDTLFSGFPQQAKLRIENDGNITFPKNTLTLSSKRIQFVQNDQQGQNQITLPIAEIPPYGNVEMSLDIKTGTLTESYSDFVLVGYADQVFFKEVRVMPFYQSPVLLFIALAAGGVIVAFYIVVLGVHLRIGHDGITFVYPKKKSS